MFHLLAAGTHLYRVTDIGRSWQDVVSGVGSHFAAGGRYNRVQQRTVYAATNALVSIAETAAHVAMDRWRPRKRLRRACGINSE
jgi:RES domain-containing protein